MNPRYTGRQVWNKQRTDEVLLDVDDVALGHIAVMRWNGREQWLVSKDIVHTPLVDEADFDHVQQMLTTRARTATTPRRARRSRHPYVFENLVFCGVCGRIMQAQHSHGVAYYRCRFPQEYALANKVEHPRNVIMREDALITPLDTWLVGEFGPWQRRHTIAKLLDQLTAAHPLRLRRRRWDRRWPSATRSWTVIGRPWRPARTPAVIAETQAERQRAEQRDQAKTAAGVQDNSVHLTEEEIIAIVEELGDTVTAVRDADPEHKLEVYRSLGLRLTMIRTRKWCGQM